MKSFLVVPSFESDVLGERCRLWEGEVGILGVRI